MTQPTTQETPPQDVHTPPDGTLIGMTYQGREAYLIPCAICGAAIPVLRAHWWAGNPGPHIRAHNRTHTPAYQL